MSEYSYEYEYDNRYCYPHSTVLINKLGITDACLLNSAEREVTSLRIGQLLAHHLNGNFDLDHLKDIHKFLFGDLYPWAGEFRKVNIAKGNQFCRNEYIEAQLTALFDALKAENYLRNCTDRIVLAKRLAYYLGEINAIHPFREGNGRAQRMFIEHLAFANDFELDFAKVTDADMLEASVQSFNGDYRLLETLIENALSRRPKQS